jgi:hypothetical protein
MPLESFAEPEVAVAAVVVGTAASPKLRGVVRRSAVYGLAGALIAYDKTAAIAQSLVKGIREGVETLKKEKESDGHVATSGSEPGKTAQANSAPAPAPSATATPAQ